MGRAGSFFFLLLCVCLSTDYYGAHTVRLTVYLCPRVGHWIYCRFLLPRSPAAYGLYREWTTYSRSVAHTPAETDTAMTGKRRSMSQSSHQSGNQTSNQSGDHPPLPDSLCLAAWLAWLASPAAQRSAAHRSAAQRSAVQKRPGVVIVVKLIYLAACARCGKGGRVL